MKKKEIQPLGITLLLLAVISLTSAFGVGSFYWDTNPLRLYPGESATVSLALQNMVGTEDYTFRVNITEDGKGIATLVDEDGLVFIPANTQRLDVPIKITIPSDVAYGETRDIFVTFVPVEESTGGMISISAAVGTKFPVQIVTKEQSSFYEAPKPAVVEEPSSTMGIKVVLYIILILIVVIIFLIISKKNKE